MALANIGFLVKEMLLYIKLSTLQRKRVYEGLVDGIIKRDNKLQ